MIVGVSGAITALGDTLFPAESFAEGLQAELSVTANLFERLRIAHPIIAVASALAVIGIVRVREDGATTGGRQLIYLLLAQLGVGVVNVLLAAPIWMQVVHLVVADAVWLLYVRYGLEVSVRRDRDRFSMTTMERVSAAVQLTKPRIIELLLVTTVPAMMLAAGGWPGTWLVIGTLVGGTLSAGGANALNNYLDRDIDVMMRRTSKRPLPTQSLSASAALVIGVTLGIGGFVVLATTSNLLAASLSTAALLFYVFVYTMLLKRNTVQNIVIGGAAGAAPALVGWAAVADELSIGAWIMFAIVFMWTPPHFLGIGDQVQG